MRIRMLRLPVIALLATGLLSLPATPLFAAGQDQPAGMMGKSMTEKPMTAPTGDPAAMAEKYENMAKQARELAQKHREMMASNMGGMKMTYMERMKTHCSDIISLQDQLADAYDKLAADYRAEAAAK